MTTLTINGITLDLSKVAFDKDLSKPGYVLLQLQRNLTTKEKDDIKTYGLRLVEYVGSNTYICDYAKPASKPAIEITGRDYYKDVFMYPAFFRRSSEEIKPTNYRFAKKNPKDFTEPERLGIVTTFAIVLHESGTDRITSLVADLDKIAKPLKVMGRSDQLVVVQLLTELPAVDLKSHQQMLDKILIDVVAMTAVRAIEALPTFSASLNYAREVTRTDRLQPPGPVSAAYLGEGEIIAIADSGLDTGEQVQDAKWSGTSGAKTDKFIDPEYDNEHIFAPRDVPKSLDGIVHPSFIGRIAAMGRFIPNTAGIVLPIDDREGHGTFIAGCAASNPVSVVEDPNNRVLDRNALVQGSAPSAKLFILTFHWAPGMTNLEQLFLTQYTGPKGTSLLAPIHNNSWNSVPKALNDTQMGYGFLTGSKVDQAMWQRSDLLICFAAGNDGAKWGNTGAQISGVAAAKNCITVGASRNMRRAMLDDDRAYSQSNGTLADVSDVADFSCRGPTRAGRIKPDVVAPGACILAPRSLAMRQPKVDGMDLVDDKRFTVSSGTSCAAPIVSGCAAILRQAFIPELVATILEARILKKSLDTFGVAMLTAENIKSVGQKNINVENTRLAAAHRLFPKQLNLTADQEQKVNEEVAVQLQSQFREDALKDATLTPEEKAGIKVPSGAMLKALLIHGAEDLMNHSLSITVDTPGKIRRRKIPIPPAPNGIQGFGRINMENSIRPLLARTRDCGGVLDQQRIDLGTEVELSSWILAQPTTDVSATLTWTDPPAEALQQYLVLKIVHLDGKTNKKSEFRAAETQEWRASMQAPRETAQSPPMVSPPVENNVQRVLIKGLPPGRVQILVDCQRTYLYEKSAVCSVVWSTNVPQPSILDKAGDAATVKKLAAEIKTSLYG